MFKFFNWLAKPFNNPFGFNENPSEKSKTPSRHIYSCSICGESGDMNEMKEHFLKSLGHQFSTTSLVGSITYLYSE